jgi:hypothetical protein
MAGRAKRNVAKNKKTGEIWQYVPLAAIALYFIIPVNFAYHIFASFASRRAMIDGQAGAFFSLFFNAFFLSAMLGWGLHVSKKNRGAAGRRLSWIYRVPFYMTAPAAGLCLILIIMGGLENFIRKTEPKPDIRRAQREFVRDALAIDSPKTLARFTENARAAFKDNRVVGFDGEPCGVMDTREDSKFCTLEKSGRKIPAAKMQEILGRYYLEAAWSQGLWEYCPSITQLRRAPRDGNPFVREMDAFFDEIETDTKLQNPLGWEAYSVSDWEKLRAFVIRWEKFYDAHPQFRDLEFLLPTQFGCRGIRNMDDGYAAGYLGDIVEDFRPEQRVASYENFLRENAGSKYYGEVKEALEKLKTKGGENEKK